MPWSHDQSIRTLRLTYNAAVAAHANCSRSITEARMSGQAPSPDLVEAEANARIKLNEARTKLLAAMTESITGGVEADLPFPQP